MASIYKKNNKIYISWYDFTLQKRLNKSLELDYNSKNWKQAQLYKKQFEIALKEQKSKMKGLSIKKKTITEAYRHFLQNNQQKHPKTIKDYNRFFAKFIETFDADKPTTVITKLAVEDWLNKIKLLHVKRNTIFGYYKQLNHFLNFLFEYNYIPLFRINRDVKPKPELVEKIVISVEDMAIIFGMLQVIPKTENFRNLLLLLYYTGLRASDLLSINIKDVDIKEKIIKYYSPKRKVFRTIAFHEDLVSLFSKMKTAFSERAVLEYKNVESLQRAINRYFNLIGFEGKQYTSRSFRKTFITWARRSSMDESIVKELVGHSHSSTTDRFYNKIETKQMIEELQKFPVVESLPYDEVKDRIVALKEKISSKA